ncbi:MULTISPECIES: hypothetical protein [unclassified Streptomyces]|uniref:hypothetical protein n=1 Tax=unclassified Streptomyces TaxID=2593676 RepID=UPI0033B5DE1E
MKIAGFFQELWPKSFGEPVGSVREYVETIPYPDSKEVTAYLLAGHELFSVMGSSADVMGSERTILGGDSIFSDGEWIWRGDLWFYLRTYHVRLPAEFLAHARNNNYVMPAEDEAQLTMLAKSIQKKL